MITVSRAKRIADQEKISVADVLSRYGVDAPMLAEAVIVTFFAALLRQNTRLGDLQPGNVGVNTCGRAGLPAIFDFGTTETDLSPYWTNWMLRSLSCAILSDRQGLKMAMLEVAAARAGCTLSADDLSKLDLFADACCRVAEGVATNGMQIGNRTEQSNDIGLTSQIGALGSVVEFLFNGWPLPPPVRDLCESIRRTIRNWAPLLNQQAQQSIKNQLLELALERMALGGEGSTPSVELAHAAAKLLPQPVFDIEDPENQFQLASGRNLGSISRIPAGAIVCAQDHNSTWERLTLTNEWREGDPCLNCGQRLIVLNSAIGIVGFQTEDGSKIIRFEALNPAASDIEAAPPPPIRKASRKEI